MDSQAPHDPHSTQGQFEDESTINHSADLHPVRATSSQGTYLKGSNWGMEPLEDYQEGGYHPVHIGDILGSSNGYRVIHKLGHGGFGTVWLCRDSLEGRYIALKVMVNGLKSDEILDFSLADLDQSMPGAQFIASPLDSFSVQGPNGTHQCLVLPPLGPCVSPHLWMRFEKDPAAVLRKFAYQTTQALDFLHKNQICHGDFRPSNVLVKLANLDHLSEEELLSLLGRPEEVQVQTESGENLPSSSPKYLVQPADISQLGNVFLSEEICVIDFGESFKFSSPPEDLGIPENYLPPEILLEHPDTIGPACDLWALGCTLFEIREQLPLFYMIYDKDELLAEMVRFFGKLPESWWAKWEAREEYFNADGKWLREEEDWSLDVALSKPMEIFDAGEKYKEGPKKSLETPEEEQKLMADLLYQLFKYDPCMRTNAEGVLRHKWFKL
ncbi:CMGC protein kinase [Fusarium oxysporum f. sp. lycopersici 4287]|uniref:EKC/KEOPS complex subunit BUD32 n=2 Tax=Fusarium oxysporum TaxID=5507 RepID=A0A0J9VFE5_FUSO4|nr:CMGC protein kinase [Fusarium oxysporum f. sp. lycopersici 4287]EXK27642.1 CMGC protein kinase [Fusarium oxysporum f. sp. melonis 26406]KAJ9416666.1 CMGC protein kinase [Fusarium oxysporum]KNB09626.1 CMGC protein kinase [Fusarium oxysporum f. sp. lycopersici 4287]